MRSLDDANVAEHRDFIFVALLIVSNKTDTLMDRALKKYNLTSKQWLLLVTLMTSFESSPSISDVAKATGYSLQNIKQLANKLVEKKLLQFKKDEKDFRLIRLLITSKALELWCELEQEGKSFMSHYFEGIDSSNIIEIRNFFEMIMDNVGFMKKNVYCDS